MAPAALALQFFEQARQPWPSKLTKFKSQKSSKMGYGQDNWPIPQAIPPIKEVCAN